jgi:hypothetical protein
MKLTKGFKGLLLGMILLLAAGAWASNRASIELTDDVSVGGQQLKAGDYSLRWDGNGPNVELSILKGNKVVATTPAHLIDTAQKVTMDTILTKSNADGTKSLSQVQPAGKKFALAVGQESAAGGAQ